MSKDVFLAEQQLIRFQLWGRLVRLGPGKGTRSSFVSNVGMVALQL